MVASGDLFSSNPPPRIDRSFSKRKVDCLKFPPSNRPPATAPSRLDSGLNQISSRGFPNKMMSLHRKKKSNEILGTSQQTGYLAPKFLLAKPRHLDLMEAVSQKERENRTRQGNAGSKPSVDIKQYNPDAYRKIAYNEYLTQAFGLDGAGKEKTANPQKKETGRVNCPPAKHIAQLAAKSMDSPSQMSAKDRRPKIQVMIPTKRPQSYSYVHHPSIQSKPLPKTQELPSAISPPSTTTKQQMQAEIPPARLSVVSPLSVVEMPKPRRPFSAFSLEDMTMEDPKSAPPPSKPEMSDSSDDSGEHDDRSSNYSPRTSMSSMGSDSVLVKLTEERRTSLAFSIMSPTAAGVFDNMPLDPRHPKNPRMMKSSASLAAEVDKNKPLPPAPGFGEIAPLKLSGLPTVRSSSLKRRKVPAPLNVSRTPSFRTATPKLSRNASLRSKYTPADLDALDEAFRKTSPTNLPAPEPTPAANLKPAPAYAQHSFPTLSQAELALEAQLGTIDEDSTLDSVVVPLVHDPLQISRGPGHMEPTRKAPPPPPSVHSMSDNSRTASRRRLQKRSGTHVAMQMRSHNNSIDGGSMSDRESLLRAKRISAPVVGSVGTSDKARKILGSGTATPMERDSSSESHWSSSDSPQGYTSSSNMSSREESLTPESDLSSIPDATFEEVRKRLELLSPKQDEADIYITLQEQRRGSETSSVKLPLQVHSNLPTPGKKSQFGEDEIPEVPAIPKRHRSKRSHRSSPAIELESASIPPKTPSKERHVHPLERRGRQDDLPVRSLASIAMSEIPDMYASLPSPAPTLPPLPMTQEEVERQISADAAEVVLLRILENLDNLQDLFATATVSRGFYRTFKRHELPLMKNALYGMSPAAWELREMSPPYPGLEGAGDASPKLDYTPTLYLQHYMRDMYTMIALKSMILIHCESFLRADTITALAGGETERASQIDDAFWRVWTFCRVFGCGNNREDDITAQMDWLRGGPLAKGQRKNLAKGKTNGAIDGILSNPPPSFGQGNIRGLSAEELYDMTEIWTCLGVLVRGFQGKRQEARDYGIFEGADIPSGDVDKEDTALEEWTYHLLTLAPPTVLDVTSPHSPTATTFAHARSRGYTTWSPPALGASRSTFLKEAVSRVYEEKMCQRHPTVVVAPSSPSSSAPSSPSRSQSSRQRCAAHAAEIRAKRKDPAFKALPPSEERPMSNYPNVLEKLENNATVPEVPPVPTQIAPLNVPPPSTPKRNPTPQRDPSPNYLPIPSGPQVRDPVDVAVDRLVAMGFDEKKSKKALADTDSGNSVDFDKAVEVLVRERKRDVGGLMHWGYRGRLGKEDV
ncbi:MAG: hypothetical protein Q9167_005889 [Letrouitia subvulpina]